MRYGTSAAFDRAISDRLRTLSSETGITTQRLRFFVAFDRFLARLNEIDDQGFVVKGGVALEYRIGANARPTKDLDLAMHGFDLGRPEKSSAPEGERHLRRAIT